MSKATKVWIVREPCPDSYYAGSPTGVVFLSRADADAYLLKYNGPPRGDDDDSNDYALYVTEGVLIAEGTPPLDWSKTTAVWTGEDWVFDDVPLDAAWYWKGHTCFSPRDLGIKEGATPEQAIAALQDYLSQRS
jgi:hypothetical protein